MQNEMCERCSVWRTTFDSRFKFGHGEILNSLAEYDRRTVSSIDTRQVINRASLKIPVQTISELNEIEEDEDKLSTLARILQRDARSFDAKRTTYMAMKLIMQNRVAEFLNMEGRGDKTAFVK